MRTPLLLALAAAAPAAAQVQVPRTETRADGTYERVTRAHTFASCLADRFAPAVGTVLAEVPGSEAERRALERLSRRWEPCLRRITDAENVLQVRPAALRGPLAEALLEARAGARPPLPAADSAEGDAQQWIALRRFADCAVGARSGEGTALLASAPGSAEESTEVRRIVNEHDVCFPPGEDVAINIPNVRGFVAEALYRRAAAATGGR